MQNLNLDRIRVEILGRLLTITDNATIGKQLTDRSMEAIQSQNLANLCSPIRITKQPLKFGPSVTIFIPEERVSSILSETGVMDIVCLCINAQR